MKRMSLFVVMAFVVSVIIHTAYAGEEEGSIALAKKGQMPVFLGLSGRIITP